MLWGHSPKFTSPAPIPAPSSYLGIPPTCSLICLAACVGRNGPGPTKHCSLSIFSMSGPRLSQEVTFCLLVCGALRITPLPINTAAELLTPVLVTYTLMLTPGTSFPLPGIVEAKPPNHLIPGTRDPPPQTRHSAGGRNPLTQEAESQGPLSAPICQATQILVSLSPNMASPLHLAPGIRFLRAQTSSETACKTGRSKDWPRPCPEPTHGARDAHSLGCLSPLICPLPISLSADRGPDPLFGC